jgi:spermidine synthase
VRRVPLSILTAVSGASALVYQSLWMRAFGLVFGNTTDAVAVVLAVFMGGLALGSALSARAAVRDPMRAYARVELGIALTALATIPALRALPAAYAALARGAGLEGLAEHGIRWLAAAGIVLPTTVLIGATLPLLVEAAAGQGGFTRSLGRLYLANTLGAALGVLLSAFLVLPAVGVTLTLVVAALGNLAVAAAAREWVGKEAPPTPSVSTSEARTAGSSTLAVLAFLSGAAAFALEVVWTRSFALVIGSSAYAFDLMLAAILLGLVGGTLLYQRRWSARADVSGPLAAAFALLALLVLASPWIVGRLPLALLALMKVLPVSFVAHQAAAFLLCLAAMGTVTLVLGVTFPLLAHLADPDRVRRSTGLLYAWNTAGAIAGALAADLLLVRRLGLPPSYVVIAAALGLAAVVAWRAPVAVRLATSAALVSAVAALAPRYAPWDRAVMTAGVYKYGLEWKDLSESAFALPDLLAAERRLVFYEEGAEAVVAVSESTDGKRRYLSVNGKTDAGDGSEDVLTQKFIAHVPLALHPDPRRVLVVGWGAGATAASALLHPIQSLECVEIEPATFRAAPFFTRLSGAAVRDPRFRVQFGDGRNALLAARAPYDVVVSEPSNPWISGVSNLFTRDFYAIVADRLAPGGVFGQWFHYYDLAPEDVKVELKTFATVFPQASLWLVPPQPPERGGRLGADFLLVGSRQPHALDVARLERLFRETRMGVDLASTGVVDGPASLVAAWAMDRDGLLAFAEDRAAFPRGTPLNTDDFPYVEFVAPRRNVTPRVDAVRSALDLYQALGRGEPRLLPALAGVPDAAAEARLLAEVSDRQVRAALPERAVRTLEVALRRAPASAELHARLGELLADRGRAGDAEVQLRRAVDMDPSLHAAWDRLSTLYLDRRDLGKAEAAHRELIRLRPEYVPAYLRLGAILVRQHQWRAARETLDQARRRDAQAPIDPQLLRYIDAQVAESGRTRG